MEFKFQFYCSTSKGRAGQLNGAISPYISQEFSSKVITKIIFERLATMSSRVMSPNQFCFVKGRQIQDAIVIVSDCVSYLHKRSYRGNVALKIDIRKAFDKVSWDFVLVVLEAYDFRSTFRY